MIIHDFGRTNVLVDTLQMEQWSILSNVVNYVHRNRSPVDYFRLEVKVLEPKNH